MFLSFMIWSISWVASSSCLNEQMYWCVLFSNIYFPSISLFTPTHHLTSTFPASYRAAVCCFNLLFSPPTSQPNMSPPPPLTALLLTSLYNSTSLTTATLQCILPTIQTIQICYEGQICKLPKCFCLLFAVTRCLYTMDVLITTIYYVFM